MSSKLTRIVWPLLAAAVCAAAQTNTWELGHPDAKLLMGIDLKSLRESAVGQSIRSQIGTQTQQMGPAALAFGFLEQIDRIFISSPALSPPAAKTASAKGNPPFLLVVEGTMPLQELLAFLPGTPHRYHMVDVYRGTKPTDSSMAMLDSRTIVLGDEKSVLGAIDRRGHNAPPASSILSRAKELAATHDVWMIATDDLSKFQPASTGFSSPLAGQIKGLDMGFAVRDGFQFEMSLAAESEKAAAQLTQFLTEQIALAQAKNPETAEAARKLQIGADGNHMRVSLALTKDELMHNLLAFQTARAAAVTASAQSTAQPTGQPQPRATPSQSKPAAPGKIKIYGLDEGVREIQLTH